MFREINFIALITNNENSSKTHTIYFFEKEEKIVLPVKILAHEVPHLLKLPEEVREHHHNIYETLVRTVLGLGGKIIAVSVYKFQDEVYYTYLNLINKEEKLEISLKFTDGVKIAQRFNLPIYIKQEILWEQGIKVNKKILRDALNEDINSGDY